MAAEGEEREHYYDVVKGTFRPRRGRTGRIRRGPYSVEEEVMITAFDKLLSRERRMHGRLAQPTCVDITHVLARLDAICERYSYENVPDVRGINPHIVMEEMDWQPYGSVVDAEPDVDVYDSIRDALQ